MSLPHPALLHISPWMQTRNHFSMEAALKNGSLRMETTLRMWKKEMRDQRGPGPIVWAQDRTHWFETCLISGSSSNWFEKCPLLLQLFWVAVAINCNWNDCKPENVISKAGKCARREERRRAKHVLRAWPDKYKTFFISHSVCRWSSFQLALSPIPLFSSSLPSSFMVSLSFSVSQSSIFQSVFKGSMG